MRMRSVLRTRPLDRSGEEGAVAIMAAALLAALLVATSMAVDVGRVSYVSRDQQGVTDRAALDALGIVEVGGSAVAAEQGATNAMERNPGSRGTAADRHVACVSVGYLDPDEASDFVAVETVRFPAPDGFANGEDAEVAAALDDCPTTDEAAGVTRVNAVWVTTASFVPFVFALGDPIGGRIVTRRSVARTDEIGALSVGSTLAAVEDGLLNDLIGGLLGGDVSASLVGFRGMVDADLDLGLLATQLGVGRIEDLVDLEVTVGELIRATARGLEAGGSSIGMDVDSFMGPITSVSSGLPSFRLGELLAVAPGSGGGTDVAVDAFDLVVGGLQVANQAAGRAVTLQLNVLGGLPVSLAIIQAPQIAVGPPGRDADGEWVTVARTAQVALDIGLPVGTVASATTSAVDTETASAINARRTHWRNRVDSATSCSGLRTVMSDLENEIKNLQPTANQLGLSALVTGLLTGVGSLVSGLLNGVGCLLGIPSGMRTDARNRVDEFRNLLTAMHGAASTGAASAQPTLRVTAASASAALDRIECGVTRTVDVVGAATAASVDLPPTNLLDLGPLGRVRVAADGLQLGGTPETPLTFVGPPYATQQLGTTGLGLAGVVPSLDTAGSSLLFVDISGILAQVNTLLAPVFTGIDGAISPLLELLGARVGVADVDVLDATCSSRRLVRNVGPEPA